jgi:hypothetical protein
MWNLQNLSSRQPPDQLFQIQPRATMSTQAVNTALAEAFSDRPDIAQGLQSILGMYLRQFNAQSWLRQKY